MKKTDKTIYVLNYVYVWLCDSMSPWSRLDKLDSLDMLAKSKGRFIIVLINYVLHCVDVWLCVCMSLRSRLDKLDSLNMLDTSNSLRYLREQQQQHMSLPAQGVGLSSILITGTYPWVFCCHDGICDIWTHTNKIRPRGSSHSVAI